MDRVRKSKREFPGSPPSKKVRKRKRSPEPDDTITPGKRGRKEITINESKFIDHLIDCSEPADSTKPDGDRNFVFPVDVVVSTYEDIGTPGNGRSNLKKNN